MLRAGAAGQGWCSLWSLPPVFSSAFVHSPLVPRAGWGPAVQAVPSQHPAPGPALETEMPGSLVGAVGSSPTLERGKEAIYPPTESGSLDGWLGGPQGPALHQLTSAQALLAPVLLPGGAASPLLSLGACIPLGAWGISDSVPCGVPSSWGLSGCVPSASSAAVGSGPPPEAEQAWPQSSGEEELQLQLALAMSKEEADQVPPRGRGPSPFCLHLHASPPPLQLSLCAPPPLWRTGPTPACLCCSSPGPPGSVSLLACSRVHSLSRPHGAPPLTLSLPSPAPSHSFLRPRPSHSGPAPLPGPAPSRSLSPSPRPAAPRMTPSSSWPLV